MVNLNILDGVIRFIEENLQKNLTVQQMADEAGYSLYHFCRIFSKGTYHTPYDYLLRRRLTKAAKEVISTDRKILEIALAYQFESHEGFTRAFQRMYKLSPMQARKNGGLNLFDDLPELTLAHLLCLQEQAGFIPQILFLPALELKGVMTRMSSFSAVQVEQTLPGVEGRIPYRLVLFFENQPAFMVCASQEGIGLEEHRMEKNIPPGKYALFSYQGGVERLHLALDWVLHCWLFYSSFQLANNWVILEEREDDLCIRVPLCAPDRH